MAEYINRLVTYLKEEFELDPGEAREALTHYIDNIKYLLLKTEQSLKTDNWDELKHAAHSIKGVSSNIGDRIMCTYSIELEMAAIAPLKEESFQKLNSLQAHFRKLELEFNEKYKT